MMRSIPIAAIFLAAVLSAAPSGAQQAVLLRFRPPVGQVARYRNVVEMWMRIPGVPAADTTQPFLTQTMYSTRRILSHQHGAWTSSTIIDSSRMGGTSGISPNRDMYRGMVIRQTMDSLGRPESTDVTPPPGMDSIMAQAMRHSSSMTATDLSMPVHAVRVGDTWTGSTAVNIPGGLDQKTVRSRVAYRLERLEHVDGHRVAVISIRATLSSDASSASARSPTVSGSSTGTSWLDLDAGLALRMTMNMTAMMTAGTDSIPMRTHVELTLLH